MFIFFGMAQPTRLTVRRRKRRDHMPRMCVFARKGARHHTLIIESLAMSWVVVVSAPTCVETGPNFAKSHVPLP